jgi:hypothetical protein
VSDGRRHLVGSAAINTILLRIAEKHRDRLQERIAEDPDGLAAPAADLIRDLSVRALTSDATCATLDARIADMISRRAGDLRPAIGAYVTDVVARQPLRK